jgi:hypothetical protein
VLGWTWHLLGVREDTAPPAPGRGAETNSEGALKCNPTRPHATGSRAAGRRRFSLDTVLAGAIIDVDPFGRRASPGTGTAFLVLAAFVISFLLIRTSARLTRSVSWWPGGVETDSGLHVHHLVWGICTMMGAGFLAFAVPLEPPWWHIVAILFGIGAGFTMDEFALWFRLSDVYWQQEGRASFDAVVVSVAFAALVVVGTTPFGLDDPASVTGTAVAVGVVLALSGICFLKGRVLLGVVGLFVPLAGAFGAVRLGNPSSPWAKRRYAGERLERARERFSTDARAVRWQRRMGDLIAGAPSRGDDA